MAGPKQHVIQRFHLAQFAGDQPRGHVWIYDTDERRSWSNIPENIGAERHFYSVRQPDGSWDTRIDDLITEIEGAATPIYRALLRGELPASDTDKHAFAVYLALTYARTPKQRRVMGEAYGRLLQTVMHVTGAHDEAFDAAIKSLEEESGAAIDPEMRQALRQTLADPSDYKMVVPKEETLFALDLIDDLTPIFEKMNWHLLSPAHGYFVTADNPIGRAISPRSRSKLYGDMGFLNPTIEVTFPLSPKLILLMTRKEGLAPRMTLSREGVVAVNHVRAVAAERYVYSHRQDKRVMKLALENKRLRPQMLVGGGPKSSAEVQVARNSRSKS